MSADAPARAEAYAALGQVYDEWGRYANALTELEQGLRHVGSDPSLTRARLLRVRCSVLPHLGKDRIKEAIDDGQKALEIAQIVDDRYEEAYAHNNLGAAYGFQGDYEKALEYHRHALELREELGQEYEKAMSLDNIGTALDYLGELDEAEQSFKRALEILEKIDYRYGLSHPIHGLAWVYWGRGDLESAEETFLQELSICEEIDDRLGIAFIHNEVLIIVSAIRFTRPVPGAA